MMNWKEKKMIWRTTNDEKKRKNDGKDEKRKRKIIFVTSVDRRKAKLNKERKLMEEAQEWEEYKEQWVNYKIMQAN